MLEKSIWETEKIKCSEKKNIIIKILKKKTMKSYRLSKTTSTDHIVRLDYTVDKLRFIKTKTKKFKISFWLLSTVCLNDPEKSGKYF